jgi:pimeloyl-ACP methyl ester carboxylesterase
MIRIISSSLQVWVFILFALIGCNQKDQVVNYEPKFLESEESLFKINEGQEYTFGYIEVPENRSNPQSRMIRLPVYIFKSRNANPAPDPIIYTVGGPGQTTMPSVQYMAYYTFLDDRDFILMEQRGTYYAQPALPCPQWEEALYLSNLPGSDVHLKAKRLAEAAVLCRDSLVSQGIDLNGYNTLEIANDVADLVKVLNIEEYNLWTISYSTKVAQVVMRDFPEGLRSVVMDSALPLEVNYEEENVTNLMTLVDNLLDECAVNKECSEAFPDLKNKFYQYLSNKTQDPLQIQVINPNNKKEETFLLKGKDLISVITNNSKKDVPYEINKLLNNDLSTLKAELEELFIKKSISRSMGMRLSVWCAEESPFVSQEKIEMEKSKYPFLEGISPAFIEKEMCTIWGVEKVADIENKPVKSNIPVLVINGGYDHETPSVWAYNMKKNLKNSHHLIFRGWTHTPTTNWSNRCAMRMAQAFFNHPYKKPDLPCYSEIEPLVFKI